MALYGDFIVKGQRAIIQSTILCRLVQMFPNFLDEIDLIAGTSAGSIVAGTIAAGLTPEETTQLWLKTAGKIFTEGFIHRMTDIKHAAYSNDELRAMLLQTFGEKTLKDLPIKVLIPSFKLDPDFVMMGSSNTPPKTKRWHPEFFHNLHHSNNSHNSVVDVILRSAAAPTYFPAYQGFVDGGTFANNPALAAVTAVCASGVELSEISVLSISTGNNPRSISQDQLGTGDWGLYEWGPHIIDLLLDSTTQSIDWQCRSLLGDRYLRLDPILERDYSLDDATALDELMTLAKGMDISIAHKWIIDQWGGDPQDLPIDPLHPPVPPPEGWNCSIQ